MSEIAYDTFEDELNAIRLQLYEETFGMSSEEEIAYIEAQIEPVYKEFNIKRSNLKPIKPFRRERLA